MRYGIWLSWGSILTILLLSLLTYLGLLSPETLGICEALLLCGAWLGASAGKHRRPSAYKLVALVAILAVIVAVWLTHPLLFIYMPAIGINLLLAGFCFSTLRPGSEPAITRIARMERDEFSDELYAYTRGVTWAWALFFSGLIVEAIALITFAPIEITLLFLNLINYALIAVFFLAEYIYRRIRLRHYTHMSPLTLAVRLSRRGFMSLIRYRGQG